MLLSMSKQNISLSSLVDSEPQSPTSWISPAMSDLESEAGKEKRTRPCHCDTVQSGPQMQCEASDSAKWHRDWNRLHSSQEPRQDMVLRLHQASWHHPRCNPHDNAEWCRHFLDFVALSGSASTDYAGIRTRGNSLLRICLMTVSAILRAMLAIEPLGMPDTNTWNQSRHDPHR